MIAIVLGEQRFHRRAAARHLAVGKARNFGFDDACKMWGKRHAAFFGSATIMSSSMRAPGDDN